MDNKKMLWALRKGVPLRYRGRTVLIALIGSFILGISGASAGVDYLGQSNRSVAELGGGPAPNSAPVLYPISGCTYAPSPTFSWEKVSNATDYRISIYARDPRDPGADQEIADLVVQTASYTPSTHYIHGFEYRWRVQALNPAGAGPYSDWQEFTFCSTDKAWEVDTFDELNIAALNGQNGWATASDSPLVVPFEAKGNILRIDRLSNRAMVIKKNIPIQTGGQQILEFEVMVSGATKPSLSTLAILTNQNNGWNKKVQFKIGSSINVIYAPSGDSFPIVDHVIMGHWYKLRCVLDLERGSFDVWLDGQLEVTDLPMHPGPIKSLQFRGQIGLGEVRFDNLLGFALPEPWTVRILAPVENQSVSGIMELTAETTGRTQWVEFYMDNALLFLDDEPPYSLYLDTNINPLPAPTHPMDFGYYFVEWKDPSDFDRARQEVAGYTNLYYASRASYDSALGMSEWLELLRRSLTNAANEGRTIHLAMDTESTWEAMLEVARPFWGFIDRIEVGDEPNLSLEQTEGLLQRLNILLDSKGLDRRPLGFVYAYDVPLPDAVQAPSMDWVGIEAYLDPPGLPDSHRNIANLESNLQSAMDQVPPGKDIILVMMAYDRNGQWLDIDNLRDLQYAVYMVSRDDPRVVAINMFAYSRSGGTRDHPSLTTAHKLIADQLFKRIIPFAGNGRRTLAVRAVDDLGNEIWDYVHVEVANLAISPTPVPPARTLPPSPSPTPPSPTWTPAQPSPTPIGSSAPSPTSSTPIFTTLPATPTPVLSATPPGPPQVWEADDFRLPLGPLDGQNGWQAVRASADIQRLYGFGKVLEIDPEAGETIEMWKDLPDLDSGALFLSFEAIITDAHDPSLAKISVETYQNSGWNRKFQVYLGSSIRINNDPAGGAEIVVNNVPPHKKIKIGLEIDLGNESVLVYINGDRVGDWLPMHTGPITGLSISGWDLEGAVYLDNFLGTH